MHAGKFRKLVATSQYPQVLKRLLCDDPKEFHPKKALVLSKVSRYEFEKYRHKTKSDLELERLLLKRGSNFQALKKHHDIHKKTESQLIRALEEKGIETKICQRFEYTDSAVKWADIIFSAGGDGTFLMAASKLNHHRKPLVGINTDPQRSEGYLCLPKYFSDHVAEAVDKIGAGEFSWFLRKRLRITLIGDRDKISEKALELHSQQLTYPEYRYVELISETTQPLDHPLVENPQSNGSTDVKLSKRVLPILALNEVFVGESLSSRVSYLEVQLDQDKMFKTRNSGLIISTGTGSTSWTFNVNKLTHQSVESLLRIVKDTTGFPLNWQDDRLVQTVTENFNHDIVFDPEANMMTYTLRDPHSVGTFPVAATEKKPRGHAQRIEVKSRCFDACLVIDGSLSFKFNDGMKAVIEIHDEDALRTIQINSASFLG